MTVLNVIHAAGLVLGLIVSISVAVSWWFSDRKAYTPKTPLMQIEVNDPKIVKPSKGCAAFWISGFHPITMKREGFYKVNKDPFTKSEKRNFS